MITRKRIELSEKQAALLWQQVAGRDLTCVDERPVRVIYPGRANGDKGPDFRDAVIEQRCRLRKGDVEVHVRSSDWHSHRHDDDAEYNDVILHVVLWHDCNSITRLQSGRPVPLLSLTQALQHQAYLLPDRLPCFQILDRMDTHRLARLLRSAGEERFRHKAAHFRAGIPRLAMKEAGQVLFRGMMRALGYSKNAEPFEALAERTTLNSTESAQGLAVKQALLLGTAGLLPSQRWPAESLRDQEVQELEQAWRSRGKTLSAMKSDDWNLSQIYPNNSPVRRIIAQSHLLDRYCEAGLLAGMMHLVMEAPLPGGTHALEHGLTVPGDGYWRDHFDFGLRSRTRASALLGNSKAREIAVNVVQPFALSWGRLTNESHLSKKAMDLYHSSPGLADNCITRHMMTQLGLQGLSDLTACHQQGLIHIFRHYCREGKCSLCPLVARTGPT